MPSGRLCVKERVRVRERESDRDIEWEKVRKEPRANNLKVLKDAHLKAKAGI